jgi:RNA polymerase sigma-70 factor (ECF subfamily)
MAQLTDDEFVGLLDRYRDEFFRYVLRNVWNPDVSEDVFSSAVLAAYKQIEKFEGGTNFRAWMYRILTNKCYVANRETKRMAIDLDSVPESRLAVEPKMSRKMLNDPEWFLEACGDEVHRALTLLSTKERSCFLLLTFGKYAYKEIANILEMPVGTVMTHLARGRAKMRKVLTEYAKTEGIIDENYTPSRRGRGEARERRSA